MEHQELSRAAKAKLTKWIPGHANICISEMVKNMPDESTLLKMMDYIDECIAKEKEKQSSAI